MSSKYEAEKVMDPILRRWFAIDLDPIDVEHNAENAAVDLSWALEGAGLLNNPTIIDEDGVDHICAALIEVGPWDEIDGDGTEASIIADHIRDLPRLLAPPPGDGWWDTGHTSTACGCNHHWDAHTPFRGCSVCSCKLDPPNQPPPPGEPDEGEPHPWLCPHGATLLCMVCGDLSSGDNKEYVLTLCEALRVAVEAAENAHEAPPAHLSEATRLDTAATEAERS